MELLKEAGGRVLNIVKKFEDYRFESKNVVLLESELGRIDNHIKIKTSAINNNSGNGDKDTIDRYNELILKKIRLENKLLESKSFVDLMDDALARLKEEYPIEFEAVKLRHLECRSIYQIQLRLNFGRTQTWKYIKSGEEKINKFLELVS